MGQINETTPWTKGVTTSAGDTSALLQSAMGSALFYAARSALDKYWVLQPRGAESASQLKDRIAAIFAERVAADWSGPVTVDAVNATPTFDAIVADVSLTSRRKTPAELSHDEKMRLLWWGLGILAVGVVGLLIFRKRSSASSAASAPADSEWGQGEYANPLGI